MSYGRALIDKRFSANSLADRVEGKTADGFPIIFVTVVSNGSHRERIKFSALRSMTLLLANAFASNTRSKSILPNIADSEAVGGKRAPSVRNTFSSLPARFTINRERPAAPDKVGHRGAFLGRRRRRLAHFKINRNRGKCLALIRASIFHFAPRSAGFLAASSKFKGSRARALSIAIASNDGEQVLDSENISMKKVLKDAQERRTFAEKTKAKFIEIDK